ncbi:MAG: membrane protein insertase YidC [Gemmatimonadetes bacterium]|nr:membrane protein insertase YidC [Gemmatimonadota bacterium]
MEKRLLIAVLLMGAVIMITNIFFPPVAPVEPGAKADSAAIARPRPARPVAAAPALQTAPAAARDSVVVRSNLYEYVFSTRGAALTRAELFRYPSYTHPGKPVQLVPGGTSDFLAHRIVVGADTLNLRAAPFQPSARSLVVDSAGGTQTVRFSYADPSGFGAELTYTFRPGTYLVGVQGRVTGLQDRATLLTNVGPGLAPHEAFDHHSERELALVTRVAGKVDREALGKLEGTATIPGPLAWAGIKDKYFLAAIVAGDDRPMSGGRVVDLPDVRQAFVEDGDTSVVELPRAALTTELPIATDGTFAFQAYLGPQEYGRLKAVGYELEDATPYGYRWLQPVIRPFAALIVSILNYLHDKLGIGYGWVLVIFGVMMRVVLWPLNARAMRAQMKNAAVAPLMQEIREKYADNPQKQQEEMLRLYREEGFNPMAGCLPMLVPFPVLITLFFVFQSTIGFRGAEFLWLPDLSLRDPFYILPLFLVASMFALQWISTKLSGMEQNAQMKMMMYIMPLMIGIFFFTMPSGLNLYYAATNVASMPQQMLIALERKRTSEEQKRNNPPKPQPATASKGKRKKG